MLNSLDRWSIESCLMFFEFLCFLCFFVVPSALQEAIPAAIQNVEDELKKVTTQAFLYTGKIVINNFLINFKTSILNGTCKGFQIVPSRNL